MSFYYVLNTFKKFLPLTSPEDLLVVCDSGFCSFQGLRTSLPAIPGDENEIIHKFDLTYCRVEG